MAFFKILVKFNYWENNYIKGKKPIKRKVLDINISY